MKRLRRLCMMMVMRMMMLMMMMRMAMIMKHHDRGDSLIHNMHSCYLIRLMN